MIDWKKHYADVISFKLSLVFRILGAVIGLLFSITPGLILYDAFKLHPEAYAKYEMFQIILIFIFGIICFLMGLIAITLTMNGTVPNWYIVWIKKKIKC